MKILSTMNNADNFYFIFNGNDLVFSDNFVFPGYYDFNWINIQLF